MKKIIAPIFLRICTIYTLILLWSQMTCSGQNSFKIIQLDSNNIPYQLKYEGNIKQAIQWKDRAGKHILIASETGIYQSNKFKHENDGSDAELFAYHFLIQKNQAKQSWKLYDFISDCPVDIEMDFIENTLQLSDLNHDGIAEIWLMYKKVCHGDVSPSDMRIIMYQGLRKYVVRGQNNVLTGTDENGKKHYAGGRYSFDKAFQHAPNKYRTFAKNLWQSKAYSL